MDQKKIKRINELARKSKAEGLTDSEKKEQEQLRTEYRMAVIGNLKGELKNVKIKKHEHNTNKIKEQHDSICH